MCLCACVRGRETGEPEGPGQQSQAAQAETNTRGFKQAPACNIDETGAPCRTSQRSQGLFGFNCLSFHVSVIDFTPRGVLARWSFLFVAQGTVSWVRPPYPLFSSSFPLCLSPSTPHFPPASLQTASTNRALTFTAVLHITAEQPPALRKK